MQDMKGVTKTEIKIGQVYYTSWGYDQTNIDMLRIVSVSPSGKTVMCRMIGKEDIPESFGLVKPSDNGLHGEPFRMHIKEYGTAPDMHQYLVGSYPYCEGDKRLGHFGIYDHPVYETPYNMQR